MSAFSHSPPPVDPSEFYGDHGRDGNELLHSPNAVHTQESPSLSVLTRTVAIIKTQALHQRLEIEPRILEANFEIVKERQMEFDPESDPETFYELFGDDARFLGDGPVWLYVLERRRAVQVLLTLLPSLNDAVIGVKSDAQAEMLIASLFASSPPFPPSELPHVESETFAGEYDCASLLSVNSAILEALQLGLSAPVTPPEIQTPSPSSSDARAPGFAKARLSLGSTRSNSSSREPVFRARPLPKTHHAPDIAPRLTKAALLRQGLSVDGTPRGDPLKSRMSMASTGRIPPPRKDKENDAAEKEWEKERARKTFTGVPGHKRSETISVASTAPPVIAPRLTKAAALRLGLEQPATPPGKKRMSISGPPPKAAATLGSTNGSYKSVNPVTPRKSSANSPSEADGEETETEGRGHKNTFEGVPGHKRRESFSVLSTKPPTIVPRTNKSAALRKEGGPPPSSFMFRTPGAPKTPGSGTHSRSSSVMSACHDGGNPTPLWGRPISTVPPRTASRAASRTSHVVAPPLQKTSSYSSQTSSSGTGTGPLSTTSATSNDSESSSVQNGTTSPPRPIRRPSSLQAPTIAPRPNKSALLRQQKQAAEAAKPKSLWANASKR
ncbi:hypothetical protein PAXINDRAFT_169388 [Paxillus involutus ATCC 200175]|uniref:Nucleoside diphosphate kinase n=1 Tax=Paxillus involutus ATCC 200175 TaxID=664439 RepID=A0A0C9U757_PAXIN|nr:hypothetical protein PAXINDRAFT_169388 [Paxillus involutus ATCC 200175]